VSRNNARKKAARKKQAENPGMPYHAAWNETGAEHQQQIRAEALASLEESVTRHTQLLASVGVASAGLPGDAATHYCAAQLRFLNQVREFMRLVQ
jgi:hypothetical protein